MGALVARALLGLGLAVEGVRGSIEEEYTAEGGVVVHPVGRLDALLPRAEVLVVTLPGTPTTAGMLDERRSAPTLHSSTSFPSTSQPSTPPRLRLMPQDAILVNVGRGSVIEEKVSFK